MQPCASDGNRDGDYHDSATLHETSDPCLRHGSGVLSTSLPHVSMAVSIDIGPVSARRAEAERNEATTTRTTTQQRRCATVLYDVSHALHATRSAPPRRVLHPGTGSGTPSVSSNLANTHAPRQLTCVRVSRGF